MSEIWDTLTDIQRSFQDHFDSTGIEIEQALLKDFNKPGWTNQVWESNRYRRAHIDVVDARKTKGLWMMHCCIFPHTHNPAPIYGFDVIAGRNKITGFFHDFSPAGDNEHPLINWFANEVKLLEWKKTRQLPDWAERIFTPHIIAASNIQKLEELDQIFDIADKSINHYLNTIEETNNTVENTTAAQNYYLTNQKLNPNNARAMLNLGLDEIHIQTFINECMFPEIPL